MYFKFRMLPPPMFRHMHLFPAFRPHHMFRHMYFSVPPPNVLPYERFWMFGVSMFSTMSQNPWYNKRLNIFFIRGDGCLGFVRGGGCLGWCIGGCLMLFGVIWWFYVVVWHFYFIIINGNVVWGLYDIYSLYVYCERLIMRVFWGYCKGGYVRFVWVNIQLWYDIQLFLQEVGVEHYFDKIMITPNWHF